MEEHVGQFWHTLITRAADRRYSQAAVTLAAVRPQVALLFRALGGDPALTVENATASAHHARRHWLARIAGSGRQVELAWRDEETLRLPETIAVFPTAELNRDLYVWLAALAAVAEAGDDWFSDNQRACVATLAQFPGLRGRYERLVAAQIAVRLPAERLPAAEAAAEQAIRQALRAPGSVAVLPAARRTPQPVYLWLHPASPAAVDKRRRTAPPDAGSGGSPPPTNPRRRRRAERVDAPDGRGGLLAFRLESLFSWTEYVAVDRSTDDDADPAATQRADALDVLSIAQGGETIAGRVRFDLDLPSADNDDRPLGPGLSLPEWDYRTQRLIPDYCRLQPLIAAHAPPCPLPARLMRPARRLRQQFAALAPLRVWQRQQPDGVEIDLDAWLQQQGDRQRGRGSNDERLYRAQHPNRRDLACLLLADLSLSTDAWVNDDGRVIDVIRDSLFLFSEALSASRDRFGVYGFSSRHRDHVRFHVLKDFADTYTDAVRGRIAAIKPGYYTRMGAAIRHAVTRLSGQPAQQRLLLLLTDGKPNDLDRYEGRYGIEDTRHAVLEARRAGVQPFCVTIDAQAGEYVPHLFGTNGYVLIRRPAELPQRLPPLYVQLTRL